jgi:hypothetical protein
MYKCNKANNNKQGLDKGFVDFIKKTTFCFYKVDEKTTWKSKCVPMCNKKIRAMGGEVDDENN